MPKSKPPVGLTHLGHPSALPDHPHAGILERVANPHPDANYVTRLTAPEFTSLCPVTGQPDFWRQELIMGSLSIDRLTCRQDSKGASCPEGISPRQMILAANSVGLPLPRGGKRRTMETGVRVYSDFLPGKSLCPSGGVSCRESLNCLLMV